MEQLTEWLEELEDDEQKQVCRQLIDEMTPFLSIEEVPHYTVELTSDAFADPFIIRDNTVPYGEDGQYYDVDGIYQTFETEEEAQEYADTLNSAENIVKLFAQKDEERSQQEQPDIQDNSDLIGKEILIDNRRYVIESISEISGDVSMRDMTFANAVGFPINRVEKIGYIRSLLSKAQEEKQPEKAVSPVPAPSEPRHNYRITEDTLGVGGAKEKFRNNMAAINLLHELELENRLATPEEQEILSKYVGWGGLSMAFDENNAAWADEFKELYASLSPEEYRAAMESTLTAFYTPPVVIKGMYEALERLGFSEGSILEPSCGTGNFFGLLPDTMVGSKLHGVEIDPLTGKIAKQLYQKAILPCRVLKKQSSQTTTLMWLSAMCRLAILRSTTAVTTPRSSLFTITFSQRLLIKFVRAVLLRSLPLREQWIRQAPKYASILLREPSCSELSDCLITLSEQTQAQRLRATSLFAEA